MVGSPSRRRSSFFSSSPSCSRGSVQGAQGDDIDGDDGGGRRSRVRPRARLRVRLRRDLLLLPPPAQNRIVAAQRRRTTTTLGNRNGIDRCRGEGLVSRRVAARPSHLLLPLDFQAQAAFLKSPASPTTSCTVRRPPPWTPLEPFPSPLFASSRQLSTLLVFPSPCDDGRDSYTSSQRLCFRWPQLG